MSMDIEALEAAVEHQSRLDLTRDQAKALRLYMKPGSTMAEVGRNLGLSRERVRQLLERVAIEARNLEVEQVVE